MHRYRSQARIHALTRPATETTGGQLPTTHSSSKPLRGPETGGIDPAPGRGDPSRLSTTSNRDDGHRGNAPLAGGRRISGSPANPAENPVPGHLPDLPPPATALPIKSEDAGAGDPPLDPAAELADPKLTIPARMKRGVVRFGIHMKNALLYSWVNVLLITVPVGIVVKAAGLNADIVFAINAIAIIPLAGLLSHATESVASRLGDTLGALLNVSFGNAVELIIFIIALVKHEISIVQASLLGSILANLLLIMGMAFLFGGLRYREQVYNNNVTQMSACLLSLSVMSLLLPTAFHASFSSNALEESNTRVLEVSRGVSVVLLIVYILYLLFQLKSHAHMYESTPQEIIDEESYPGVLAEMMNSSSSSEDSTSSSSSDTDGSGSVTTRRRMKRMFRNRRRRKSSAASSARESVPSALSSPSIAERKDHPWEHQTNQSVGSRVQSVLIGTSNSNEGDAEKDENGDAPRIRDFVTSHRDHGDSKSARKTWRKKARKKQMVRQDKDAAAAAAAQTAAVTAPEKTEAPAQDAIPEETAIDHSRDGAHEPAAHPSPGRSALNKLPFSAAFRPALPKMLSNNVFNQPPPAHPSPQVRPALPHSQTDSNHLRRAHSLPDRLNNQQPATGAGAGAAGHSLLAARATVAMGAPHQHQRAVQFGSPAGALDAAAGGTGGGGGGGDGVGDEPDGAKLEMSRTAAVVLLLATTVLVAICAEFMVDAIPAMIESSSVSQAFIGLIILPIVGNAAEHVTAVTVATKNKMDLAIGVAVGSSIQIALFVTPIVVLLGWILNTDMSLYFNLFETVSLFVTVFVVNFLVLDGRSNYLEGSLLIAAYVIIALGAYFYPAQGSQSTFGGGASDN